jgi:hypothetical protein
VLTAVAALTIVIKVMLERFASTSATAPRH